ncbi:MAG: IS256 family transposase [Spirochaetales bacterium]|nr:IS256 family transposase [Spirochaetales bacterium]
MYDTDEFNELANKLASNLKTPQDVSEMTKMLTKVAMERILEIEMEEHLGEKKKGQRPTGNSRNGYTQKTLKTDTSEIPLDIPRDREATFEPQLVKKNQRRSGDLDSKILSLYAKGMTTRDITATFKEMYDVDVSPTLISKITDGVMDEVIAWQNRPLDSVYPILFLDCIVIKVRENKRVINKSVYLALAVNSEGMKELLGLWISENEGSKFWMSVLTELQNRGIRDVFIAAVDGLTGFPEAINAVFPKTKIQLCIVHQVRNSLKYVSYKDRKTVASDLKKIYRSISENEARMELDRFAEKWDSQYPSISKGWYKNWENLIALFDYPDEIRKIIYTTNAIESLNSVIRKTTKNRKIFPNDDSAVKIIYLAIQQASKRWSMPLRNWKPAMNRFAIEYEGRFDI